MKVNYLVDVHFCVTKLPNPSSKNKICRASMVFLLQKKNPSTKIPNNPFKLESITASYCGSKLMRKKHTRDGVEI
jgi:hypothetical protein